MSKPIAMRMNAEQFYSIKGILEENRIGQLAHDSTYDYSFVDDDGYDQIEEICINKNDFEIHEEFNAKVFLNSLGIDYEETTEQVERYNIFDKAQQLIKDAKQQGVEIEIKEGVIILKQVVK